MAKESTHIQWMPGLKYTAEEKKKLEYVGIQLGWNDPDLGYTHADISNKAIIDWLKSKDDATSVTIGELDERFRTAMEGYKGLSSYRSEDEDKEEDPGFEL